MALLYDRQVIIMVAELELSEPRISFELERHADETQTTGHVNIYNLIPRARAADNRPRRANHHPGWLSADLGATVRRTGRARRARAGTSGEDHPDQPSGIWCALLSGQKGLSGVTVRSYAGPAKVRQIVRDLASDLGLPAGPLDAIPEDATETDWVWSGPTGSALRVILKGVKCTWYEQDGVLRVNSALA